MAGIAKNGNSKVVSNSTESVSELSFSTDTTSLQELIESELAMRDHSNTINKSSNSCVSMSNSNSVVCSDSNVNNMSVPINKHIAHDSSPSSKFDQIFRETFKEDSDIEETYTNTPEILSPQLTSSTELLDMSYSMKFEKLTQQETYNKQIMDPLAHQINRDDVEVDSLDLLDMSYSMKFEKLTQQETYNKQIMDPLAHQINRDDVEVDSLDRITVDNVCFLWIPTDIAEELRREDFHLLSIPRLGCA
ncbi:uncharacterized protein LOC108253449 [Diaphorina citri]|uniref:Uncharacterized protein LOC108253449 n=1 Tax=Diaphorina citri TaxID=121845 RepID=A0A3Q0JA65_DIACI|nr:uncharacterized protein LOC108253449 [Diaphorina citri]